MNCIVKIDKLLKIHKHYVNLLTFLEFLHFFGKAGWFSTQHTCLIPRQLASKVYVIWFAGFIFVFVPGHSGFLLFRLRLHNSLKKLPAATLQTDFCIFKKRCYINNGYHYNHISSFKTGETTGVEVSSFDFRIVVHGFNICNTSWLYAWQSSCLLLVCGIVSVKFKSLQFTCFISIIKTSKFYLFV